MFLTSLINEALPKLKKCILEQETLIFYIFKNSSNKEHYASITFSQREARPWLRFWLSCIDPKGSRLL